MDRWQKQVQASLLKSEDEALAALRKSYEQALKDIRAEIKRLQEKPETQSVIWQVQWQRQLEAQVSAIIDRMQQGQYSTLQGYLDGCYTDAYVGTMYDIAKQGVPVTTPIPQDQALRAVLTDSKLSKPLYQSMGKYLKPLKKAVTQEISRGIASGLSYADIARNLENRTGIGYSNAARIARTEGHRIQNAAALDAQRAAKDAGADVVKQWDATLDGRTRKDHRRLDGQIRELDEPFEVAGRKASAPGHFGRPEQDINCRCAVLQRAKWALDEDELETLKERAKFHKLDKSKDFEDFKAKYLKASKTIERWKGSPLRPESLAGAKRGEPMDFERADGNRANPNFDKDAGYRINCQSCVVTYEARLRGYDVETLPNAPGSRLEWLAARTHEAWIDPETGLPRKPERYTGPGGSASCLKWLREKVKPGERYTIHFRWKGVSSGHIVSMDRMEDGTLRLYDPQTGEQVLDKERANPALEEAKANYEEAKRSSWADEKTIAELKKWVDRYSKKERNPLRRYLDRIRLSEKAYGKVFHLGPDLLRVDDLIINPDIAGEIMKAVEE